MNAKSSHHPNYKHSSINVENENISPEFESNTNGGYIDDINVNEVILKITIPLNTGMKLM